MNGAIPLLPVVLGDIIVTYIQYFHFSLTAHLIKWLFKSSLNDKQFTSNTSCFIGVRLHVSVFSDHHQALL